MRYPIPFYKTLHRLSTFSIFLLGLWCIPTLDFAYSCDKIDITIHNKTDYDWYVDTHESDDPSSLPAKIKAGEDEKFSQNSHDFLEFFGTTYHQDIAYYVKAHAKQTGSNTDNYFKVKFHVKYDICSYQDCSHVDADADVKEDPSHIASASSSNGYSGCVAKFWDPKSPRSGSADLTITQPTAVALKIVLPKQNGSTVAEKSFLQETYNLMRPDLLTKFDTTLANPVEEKNDSLNFNVTCTSDDCHNKIEH